MADMMTFAPTTEAPGWGNAGGAPGGWYGAASGGLGAIADLGALFQNLQARQQQQRLYEIYSNPDKLSAYVSKWYAPMGAAQNQAVHRDLGAQWSTMTGGAPGGAQNQFVADALAKLESQRYESAVNQALYALKGAGGAIPGAQPMGNLGAVMKSLMTLKQMQAQPQKEPGITAMPGPASSNPIFPMPGTAGQEAPDINLLGGVF